MSKPYRNSHNLIIFDDYPDFNPNLSPQEIFELGNGKNYSINQLADAFGDYPRKYLPEKPGEVRESLNVDTKAFNMLGWKPKGDIITYIKENYILDK